MTDVAGRRLPLLFLDKATNTFDLESEKLVQEASDSLCRSVL